MKYITEPIEVIDGIPVFSKADDYTDNYEQISNDHVSSMDSGHGNPFMSEGYWEAIEKDTVSLMHKYSKPGDRILDVGVGLGRLLDYLPNTYEKHGTDISFHYLKRAKAKRIDVVYAKIEDMPYPPGYFDLIVCTDVLEHVFNLHLCIEKILHVLKPGGHLLVRVPYREDLGYYLKSKIPYKYVHLRNFDEHNMELMFTKIFDCAMTEKKLSGVQITYTHLKYNFPLSKGLNFLFPHKYVSGPINRIGWLRSLVQVFFLPNEINVVVKKKN